MALHKKKAQKQPRKVTSRRVHSSGRSTVEENGEGSIQEGDRGTVDLRDVRSDGEAGTKRAVAQRGWGPTDHLVKHIEC